MTWVKRGEMDELSVAYLRILEKIEAGELPPLPDVEGDDSDGRVTGPYFCVLCGSGYLDADDADRCCKTTLD